MVIDILKMDQRVKGTPFNLDASETVFFQRQLEKVKVKTYDKKYKNLRAQDLIPISTEVPTGALTYVWYSYSKAGTAKIISDYAHDFPRVDVFATENTGKVRSIGVAYGYSIQEIRSSALAGNSLDTRRSNTARRAVDEKFDNLAWYGDTDFNIQGFFDYPGITEYTVPVGAATTQPWPTKTPDEINADLVGIMDAVSVPTNGREQVDTILLPRARYNLLKNTRMGGSSDTTIFKYFSDNNPSVKIEVLDELLDQGAGDTQRMIAYTKDADHLTQEIPQMFEQFEPQKKGMTWEIPCHARYGGVVVYYPQSVAFGDNI